MATTSSSQHHSSTTAFSQYSQSTELELKKMSSSTDTLFLVGVVLLALILRLDFLIANNFVIDSDEAIVGLMADHILAGKGIPVFYYGQDYMGSLEPMLVSALFSIVGASSAALKTVPLLFSLLLVLIMYAIGNTLGNRFTARVAALLMALPPSTLTIWSTKARGGFIEVIVIGSIALLLCAQILPKSKLPKRTTFFIGLLLGLGWWVNNQIVYFMLPIGFMYLSKILRTPAMQALELNLHVANLPPETKGLQRRLSFSTVLREVLRHGVIGIGAFILGGLPFWIYNALNNFPSFGMFSGSTDVTEHATGFFTTALPILLGARRIWNTEDAYPLSSYFAWTTAGIVTLLLLWFRRREFLLLFIFGRPAPKPVELFTLFVFSCFAVFVGSSFGWLSQAPRYLLPIYVGLFACTAYVLTELKARSKLLSYTFLGLLLSAHILSNYYGGRALPGEPFVASGERVSKDNTELISWLDTREDRWIFTNYWVGYRIAFETDERIKFVLAFKPYTRRIKSYVEEGKERSIFNTPIVLVPTQAEELSLALNTLHYSFQSTVLSGYTVLYDITAPEEELTEVDIESFRASASINETTAQNAIDDSLHTRWASATPQRPGMTFSLKADTPVPVRAFRYRLGDWQHDVPVDLRVTALITEEGKKGEAHWAEVIPEGTYQPIRSLLELDSELFFHLPPGDLLELKFETLGSHPIFDWSIAEIELYR